MTFRPGLTAAAIAACLASPALAQGDPEAGEQVFNKCQACHQVGEDATNRVGPVLTGVVGREIASVEDFNYSDAFLAKKEEGFVWDEASLAEYLAAPRDYIPGNKMTFAGLRDEQEIADVIAYLSTFE